MLKFKNLTLIGTSHISKHSVNEVKKAIKDVEPEAVAIELDRQRLYSLMNESKKSSKKYVLFKIGFKAFLFAVIAEFVQKKLGKIVNMQPGSEMKAAIAAAHGKKLLLIDQDIEITLRNFSKRLTWKEKGRFVVDLVQGFISKKKLAIDLEKVPEDEFIKVIIDMVKKRYPNIYRTLISDRDRIMAKRLYAATQKFDSVVGVVGAGHIEGIEANLKKLDQANPEKAKT